jgi:hypothetical protein
MKNLNAIISYIERALSTREVDDLVVAYEVMLENHRREASHPDARSEIAPEIQDFQADAVAFEKQRVKKDKKIKKEMKKVEKTMKVQRALPGQPAVKLAPTPIKRTRRTKVKRRR